VVAIEAEPALGCVRAHVAAGARVGLLALAGTFATDVVPAETVVLVAPRDSDEYARVLYARLREADHEGLDVVIAVLPGPGGMGAAVIDRVTRAAAGAAG
jgi:L-threonylcarbamoyladenylate synthase